MIAPRTHGLRMLSAALALAIALPCTLAAAQTGTPPAPGQPAPDVPVPVPLPLPDPAPPAGTEPAPPPSAAAPTTVQTELTPAGDAPLSDASAADFASPNAVPSASRSKIVYVLERIEVQGNHTRQDTILRFVPLKPGDLLDVDDPEIERIRWRLMGTGWFNDVRLRLARGTERGHVVLVVEVVERNTIVISRVIAGLARVVTDSDDADPALRPYVGLGLTESNLLGLGIGLSLSGVISEHQGGFDLRYQDPLRLGNGFDLNARLFYNDARDFFGRGTLDSTDVLCPAPEPDEEDEELEECDEDVRASRAVVIYQRYGFGVGSGHEITGALRYEFDWLGEIVDVGTKPLAASTLVGEENQEIVPIDFHIDDGTSYVSSLHFGLILDRRDDPAFPAHGQLLRLDTRIGSGLIGSTYDFARIEATFRHYQPLPWNHIVSFGAYVGTVFGRAPFFYLFYAADLSDLLPSRALELNLDHRRTHNLLGTSIKDFDKEDLAVRVDLEYELPLHRGPGEVRGIDAYAGVGLFLLADRTALRVGLPGYEGLENVPVDLTFDIGIQADTTAGVFKIGFSSLIGFLPDLGVGGDAVKPLLRWLAPALSLLLLVPGQSVSAEPPVPVREVTVQWSGQMPLLSFSADDFVSTTVAEKLGSGLPQRIVTRVYAYAEPGEEPIAISALSCRVVYDLWEGVYRVQEQTETRDQSRTVPDLKGVVQACLNVRLLGLGDGTTFARHRGHRVYFAAIIELNPLSPDTVQRIRRWLSRSNGGQLRGDAFFGSFVSIFVSRRLGSAEHTLSFRSPTSSVP